MKKLNVFSFFYILKNQFYVFCLALVKAILEGADDEENHGLSSIEKIFSSEGKYFSVLAKIYLKNFFAF